MTIDQDTLAKLLEDVAPTDPQAFLDDNGVFQQLKKAIAERALNAELAHHLANEPAKPSKRNHRNGSSKKTVLTVTTRWNYLSPVTGPAPLSRN